MLARSLSDSWASCSNVLCTHLFQTWTWWWNFKFCHLSYKRSSRMGKPRCAVMTSYSSSKSRFAIFAFSCATFSQLQLYLQMYLYAWNMSTVFVDWLGSKLALAGSWAWSTSGLLWWRLGSELKRVAWSSLTGPTASHEQISDRIATAKSQTTCI